MKTHYKFSSIAFIFIATISLTMALLFESSPLVGLASIDLVPTPTNSRHIYATSGWGVYSTDRFGYAIKYPLQFEIHEGVSSGQEDFGGVPSDLWFGDRIHIISRIPPLSKEYILSAWGSAEEVSLSAQLKALRVEQYSEATSEQSPLKNIEYFVAANGATYFLIFNSTGDEERDQTEEIIFQKMVASFAIFPSRTYKVNPAKILAETDGFDFPVDPRDGSSGRPSGSNRFNQRGNGTDPSTCFGKPMWELQHAGEDWMRERYSNVYAVANGIVKWSQNENYPGAVVIIEHTLPSDVQTPWGNHIIYSMYAHLEPSSIISQWSNVKRGQIIGHILDQGSNSHTHFEIRQYGNMGQAPEWVNGYRLCGRTWPGPGYTDTGTDPGWWGYINPSDWIDHHRPTSSSPTPTPSPSTCSPDADHIVLYSETNFQGQCKKLGPGSYPNPGYLDPVGNDHTRSLKVGANVTATLYENDNYQGRQSDFGPSDVADLRDTQISYDTSSVEVRWKQCNPNADQIALFMDDNFTGRCVQKGIGEYPNPGEIGLPNDSISSVKVGANVRAILCKNDGFNDCEELERDDGHLGDNPIGNDTISSVKVERRSSPQDTTPPDGDFTSPLDGAVIDDRVVGLVASASDDASGVKEVHFNAKWAGAWHGIYIDTSQPYAYDWDLCESGVPDGDIELGLDIYDNAGNVFHLNTKHANPHITKQYNCHPNQAPYIPTQLRPANGSIHTQMPQLCWQDNGDPDGDSVQFWVDLMGAEYEQSGWINQTCWTPSAHKAGDYTWHVQARDSQGYKSDYSSDWSFGIQNAAVTPTPTQIFGASHQWLPIITSP